MKPYLESMEKMGALILHVVDATTTKLHRDLKVQKFDRIVFYFLCEGFKGNRR